MSRFADVVRGAKATKVVDLPLSGGEVVKVAVRPMNGLELGRVVASARAYAIAEVKRARPDDAREPREPAEGDRLYDLGHMVHTLATACEDPEHPGVPFFAGAEEVLGALDADRIALLYEEQQAWEDHCSPRVSRMSQEQFIALVFELSKEDDGGPDSPFDRLRPALRRSWARTISRLYTGSLTLK